MLALWHDSGYGRIKERGARLRLPGCSHALVYAWRNDNAGPPPTAADAKATLKHVARFFPNSTVEFSTLDAFGAHYWNRGWTEGCLKANPPLGF